MGDLVHFRQLAVKLTLKFGHSLVEGFTHTR